MSSFYKSKNIEKEKQILIKNFFFLNGYLKFWEVNSVNN